MGKAAIRLEPAHGLFARREAEASKALPQRRAHRAEGREQDQAMQRIRQYGPEIEKACGDDE
jgi:hypothetical protein